MRMLMGVGIRAEVRDSWVARLIGKNRLMTRWITLRLMVDRGRGTEVRSHEQAELARLGWSRST